MDDSEIKKLVEQDRDRIVTAVLKQHDRMFGTNFIPRKSVRERLAAFFKPLLIFKHHEQRND
ncbi:hypothetical protein [Burkholderia phage FLC9]|nr:hypothetical protein [Burkholderia phage FLC9]